MGPDAHVLLPKDYCPLRLTGEFAIDKADGAGTILFDLAARAGRRRCSRAGDPAAWLPPTFEGPEITGVITAGPRRRRASGRDPGGRRRRRPGRQRGRCRCGSPGSMPSRWGPPGVVFAATAAAVRARGRVHAFCHAVPGRWHLMSVMLSAAGSLRWFRDALAPGVVRRPRRAAAAVPPGSDGLLFLPYLTGERSPHPDPLARGAFVGLTLGHDRRHMTRAVLEGVAFGLRDGLDLMVAAGMAPPAQIRASGGGIASPLWRQILADVLGAEIATVTTTEGAAYGAALLASVGAGWFPSVDAAAESRPGHAVPPTRARCRGLRRAPCATGGSTPPSHRLPAPVGAGGRNGRGAGADARRAGDLGYLRSSSSASSSSRTSPGRLPRMIIPSTSSGVTSFLYRVDDAPVVHHADPVRQVEDVVDVVADQEDADAIALELADQVPDLGRFGRTERCRRLVHDQDPGVEVDRPRDGHGLALAAGQ